jgi:biofilm PGA synthesis N-glycosyltransferase PgaC
MRVVALVPAHQEQDSIGATVRALLAQERLPDLIVVIADNCSDQTVQRAQEVSHGHPNVLVVEAEGNAHRKPGALNWAWHHYCQNADLLVTLDADTCLPTNAVGDWEAEFEADPKLGGSSSKFTMPSTPGGGGSMLVRLQRAEFARWTSTGLRRGWTSVLAGTGCSIRNDVLKAIAARDDRNGPWSYASAVEDFELTYQIRKLGYVCRISPTVRAYTDAMQTVGALLGQRRKWQVGTVEDLMSWGWNDLTRIDWMQQAAGLLAAMVRIGFVTMLLSGLALGILRFDPIWLAPTAVFIANDVRQSWRIPHRDWIDVLMAALLIPSEIFAWLRSYWFLGSWVHALRGKNVDLWAKQYEAEAEALTR